MLSNPIAALKASVSLTGVPTVVRNLQSLQKELSAVAAVKPTTGLNTSKLATEVSTARSMIQGLTKDLNTLATAQGKVSARPIRLQVQQAATGTTGGTRANLVALPRTSATITRLPRAATPPPLSQALSSGVRAGADLPSIFGSLKPNLVLAGLTRGVGNFFGSVGSTLGTAGAGISSGVFGLPATVLSGLASLTGTLSGLGTTIPVIGPLVGLLGGALSGIVGAGSLVAGVFGKLASAGTTVVGNVIGGLGQLATGIATNPLVTGVLTGGISLVVQHFGTLAQATGVLVAGLLGFAAKSILQEGTQFEQAQADVKVAAMYSPGASMNGQATPELESQLQRLSPIILKIGADFQYTNGEVASGIQALLQGGVAIQSITDKTARALFTMSSVTGQSVDDAARVMTSIIQLFQVPEAQIPHVSDLITGAVMASPMSLGEYADAIKQIGPLAKTLGLSPEDVTAELGVLATNGIRGETAGTAIRNMLQFAVPKSKPAKKALEDAGLIVNGKNQFFDDQGQIKSIPEINRLLQGAMGGMTEEQQIEFFHTVFGVRASSAAEIGSMLGPDEFAQMQARIGGVTGSQAQAVKMDTVAGQFEILTGSLKNLGIAFFQNWLQSPLKSFITGLIDPVNHLVDWFTVATDATDAFGQGLAGLSRAEVFVRNLVAAVKDGDLATHFRAISTTLPDWLANNNRLMQGFREFMRVLQLGHDGVVTFKQALTGDWGGKFTQEINPVIRLVGVLGTYFGNLYRSVSDFATGKVNFSGFLGSLTDNLFGKDGLLKNLGGQFDLMGPGLKDAVSGLGKWLVGVGQDWWNTYLKPDLIGDGKTNGGLLGDFFQWLGQQGPALGAAFNNLFSFMTQRRKQIGVTMEPVTTDVLGGQNLGVKATPIFDKGMGFLDMWDAFFGYLGDEIDTNMGPTMDRMEKALQGWWKDHRAGLGALFHNEFMGGLDAMWAGANDWLKAHKDELSAFGGQVATIIGAGIGEILKTQIALGLYQGLKDTIDGIITNPKLLAVLGVINPGIIAALKIQSMQLGGKIADIKDANAPKPVTPASPFGPTGPEGPGGEPGALGGSFTPDQRAPGRDNAPAGSVTITGPVTFQINGTTPNDIATDLYAALQNFMAPGSGPVTA